MIRPAAAAAASTTIIVIGQQEEEDRARTNKPSFNDICRQAGAVIVIPQMAAPVTHTALARPLHSALSTSASSCYTTAVASTSVVVRAGWGHG